MKIIASKMSKTVFQYFLMESWFGGKANPLITRLENIKVQTVMHILADIRVFTLKSCDPGASVLLWDPKRPPEAPGPVEAKA